MRNSAILRRCDIHSHTTRDHWKLIMSIYSLSLSWLHNDNNIPQYDKMIGLITADALSAPILLSYKDTIIDKVLESLPTFREAWRVLYLLFELLNHVRVRAQFWGLRLESMVLWTSWNASLNLLRLIKIKIVNMMKYGITHVAALFKTVRNLTLFNSKTRHALKKWNYLWK